MAKPAASANSAYEFLLPLFHACSGLGTCRTCLEQVQKAFAEAADREAASAECEACGYEMRHCECAFRGPRPLGGHR